MKLKIPVLGPMPKMLVLKNLNYLVYFIKNFFFSWIPTLLF